MFLSSCRHEIFMSFYHWQKRCKRWMSKVMVTEVKTIFAPIRACPHCNSSLNFQMAKKWYTKLEAAYNRWPIVFSDRLSTFKVTQEKKSPILTLIGRFRTVTWTWIHRLWWNDAQSLKWCPIVFQCYLTNCKVTRDQKSQVLTRIVRFRTVTQVWIDWWLWNDT